MHMTGEASKRTATTARVAAVLALAGLALSGCAFTEVEPEAEQVEVLEAARVSHCERLGETQVSVAHKIGFIPRGDKAIQNDLDNLARNSGAGMGGDTVTPMGQPQNGNQTFGVYDCIGDR